MRIYADIGQPERKGGWCEGQRAAFDAHVEVADDIVVVMAQQVFGTGEATRYAVCIESPDHRRCVRVELSALRVGELAAKLRDALAVRHVP